MTETHTAEVTVDPGKVEALAKTVWALVEDLRDTPENIIRTLTAAGWVPADAAEAAFGYGHQTGHDHAEAEILPELDRLARLHIKTAARLQRARRSNRDLRATLNEAARVQDAQRDMVKAAHTAHTNADQHNRRLTARLNRATAYLDDHGTGPYERAVWPSAVRDALNAREDD